MISYTRLSTISAIARETFGRRKKKKKPISVKLYAKYFSQIIPGRFVQLFTFETTDFIKCARLDKIQKLCAPGY